MRRVHVTSRRSGGLDTSLSLDLSVMRRFSRCLQPWLSGLLALTLAIGLGLLLVEMLMSPAAAELRKLALYLTLSGAATMVMGWLALQIANRSVGLSIKTKAFLGSAIGGGVALLNVVIVAQLMFVSTTHDLRLLIALVGSSSIVTVSFSMWVASTITVRLHAVALGVRSLAAGEYGARVTVEGDDEVARLAENVNLLAQRLRIAEDQRHALDRERRELTAAISHDLRTPLASIRAMAEAIDDRVVSDPKEVERYYRTIRREIDRLSLMIDDLFELAQMDAGALRLDKRPLALQEIAAEVVDAMRAQARQHAVALRLAVHGDVPEAYIDGTRIERAIANLVRNALEHTSAGDQVNLRVYAEGEWIVLAVSDTGRGIREEDLPHIWDRFYRAERSRKRGPHVGDGAGLGLSIVRGIIEAHGGFAEARSVAGQGATFTVRLRRAEMSQTPRAAPRTS